MIKPYEKMLVFGGGVWLFSAVIQNILKMEIVDPGSKSSAVSDPFAAFFKAVQTYGSFLPDVS